MAAQDTLGLTEIADDLEDTGSRSVPTASQVKGGLDTKANTDGGVRTTLFSGNASTGTLTFPTGTNYLDLLNDITVTYRRTQHHPI